MRVIPIESTHGTGLPDRTEETPGSPGLFPAKPRRVVFGMRRRRQSASLGGVRTAVSSVDRIRGPASGRALYGSFMQPDRGLHAGGLPQAQRPKRTLAAHL